MQRAIIHCWDDPDGSWWVIGWDPARGGYAATKLAEDLDGREVVLDVVGFDGPPITAVDSLAATMSRTLPPWLTLGLAVDAERLGAGATRPLRRCRVPGPYRDILAHQGSESRYRPRCRHRG